jgi:SAM-dependent methyltransferase
VTSADDAKVWGDFWARSRKTGGAGCLPGRWRTIDAAQSRTWAAFARVLPRGARVLDLATGDGRVMDWLLTARRDLKPVGVDRATVLPDPPRGAKVRAGVAMESLPFPDARFEAACSQFGFEYGDVPAAAAELARVVRPGGAIALMTHRGDGPILAHNLQRRAAIRWALESEDLLGIARRSLQVRGLVPVPPRLAAAPAEGARLFGQGSAAWEIAEAIRRILMLGTRDDPREVARLLDAVSEQAENELGRIASLEAACARADDEEALRAACSEAGLETLSVGDVDEVDSGRPFARLRLLRRP